jgi:rubredoxin
MKRFPCPSCGYLVFDEPPGSDNICPICFWEDALSQLRFVRKTGANRVNLTQAQKNFAQSGAGEPRLKQHVRQPGDEDHQGTWLATN